MELLAMGWNMPALQRRLSEVHARFRGIFEHHFGQALREYGLDESEYPLKEELLAWIQRWIEDLEAHSASGPSEGRGGVETAV